MLPTTQKDFNRLGPIQSSNRITGFAKSFMGWLRKIMKDKNSRNLLLFLILNLSFAFVELAYGIWTNSLGLISDSFHMFFDCTGLLAGLAANIIIQWKANEFYSYGYERAEVLAGLTSIAAKSWNIALIIFFFRFCQWPLLAIYIFFHFL